MDIRDVDFDDGKVRGLQRIKQSDGRERVTRRIDDDASRLFASLMHPLDQLTLVVGLAKSQTVAKTRTTAWQRFSMSASVAWP